MTKAAERTQRETDLASTCYACGGPLSEPEAGERFCLDRACRKWVPEEERSQGTPVREWIFEQHTRPPLRKAEPSAAVKQKGA